MTPLLIETQSTTRILRLNRPDKLNAWTAELAQAVISALQQAAREPALSAIIITGEGRAFSSGYDLGTQDAGGLPDLEALVRQHFNPLIMALRQCPLPIVAAVNGVAAGVGTGLAFGSDLIVANQDAYFFQPFANIGLAPGAGNSWFLLEKLGRARASAAMMLGEKLSAQQALDWGMINAVCPPEAVMPQALAWSEMLAKKSQTSLRETKALLFAAEQDALERQLDREAAAQGRAAQGPDWQATAAKYTAKSKS